MFFLGDLSNCCSQVMSCWCELCVVRCALYVVTYDLRLLRVEAVNAIWEEGRRKREEK